MGRLIGEGLLLGKFLAFLGAVILVLDLVVNPLRHLHGTVASLACLGLFLGVLLDLVGDSSYFFRGEQRDVVQQFQQLLVCPFLVAAHGKDFGTDFLVDFGPGDFLEQFGFVVILAVEELGKLALGEYNGTEELVCVQPDEFGDVFIDFIAPSLEVRLLDTVLSPQLAGNVLYGAFHFTTRTVHFPCGDIGDSVVVVKGQRDVGLGGAAAQQLAGVFGR